MKKYKIMFFLLLGLLFLFKNEDSLCYAAQNLSSSSTNYALSNNALYADDLKLMEGEIGDKTFTLLGQKYVKRGNSNIYYLDNGSTATRKVYNYDQFYNLIAKAVKKHMPSLTISICTTNSVFDLSHYNSSLLTAIDNNKKTKSCQAYCSELIDDRSYADFERVINSTGIQVLWEVKEPASVIDYYRFATVTIDFTYFKSDQPVRVANNLSEVGPILDQAAQDGYDSITLCMFCTENSKKLDDNVFFNIFSGSEDKSISTLGNLFSCDAIINRPVVGLSSNNLMIDADNKYNGTGFEWTDLYITCSQITTENNQRIRSHYSDCACYCKLNLHIITSELEDAGVPFLSSDEEVQHAITTFSLNEEEGFLGYVYIPSPDLVDEVFDKYHNMGRDSKLNLVLYDTGTDYYVLTTQ